MPLPDQPPFAHFLGIKLISVAPERLEAGGPTPPGALFHWVTPTDNGFRITDVWESQEAFLAFAEEHIGPKSAEAGLSAPNPTFHEVHNHFIKT